MSATFRSNQREHGNVPVTHVILKDGRMGVVRESVTSIKWCKKNKCRVLFIPDAGFVVKVAKKLVGNSREEIQARDIEFIIKDHRDNVKPRPW